ncbi:MAG: TolC family protein [Bacteroidia bacterium]|nr:TolC family protein [Bacteroidia bacterium]
MTAWATANAQQADSLSAYLKEATASNPGLKAKYSLYLAALEKVPQAGALPDPEVQFGYFIKPMELMEGYQRADFRLMQMAPWFGTLKAAKDEASKMAMARYQEMLSIRNELFLQVKSSWYQVFRTKKEIEVTEKNLALLRSLERMAIIRFKAAEIPVSPGAGGMAAGNETALKPGTSGMSGENMGRTAAISGDSGNMPNSADAVMGSSSQGGMVGLLRVQIEIGSIENRISMLHDQLKTEKQRFNLFLNRNPGTEVFVSDSLMEATLPGSLTLLADSIVNNPMIRMFEADREANEARIKMAGRMGFPMVGIGLNYTLIQKFPDVTSEMNGKDMVMPMITATLPIYRNKYKALRREAEFLRDASAESVNNVRNGMLVSYQEAVQLYKDADRRIELFNRQVSLAEKTITLLTSSFSSAGTDFEEILRMQQQLLDYQFKHIEATVDRNLAIATLISIIAYN